jgi:hypothetical protein
MQPAMPSTRRQIVTARAERPHRGRIQVRIRRLAVVADSPLTTPQLVRRLYEPPFKHWHYSNVRRAAAKYCERVGHRVSRGKPVLWKRRD